MCETRIFVSNNIINQDIYNCNSTNSKIGILIGVLHIKKKWNKHREWKTKTKKKKNREIRFPWKFWFGRSGAHTPFRETYTRQNESLNRYKRAQNVFATATTTQANQFIWRRTATTTTTIKQQQQQRTISECRSLMDDLNVCHMKQTSEKKQQHIGKQTLSLVETRTGELAPMKQNGKAKKGKTLCANCEQNIYHFVIARTRFFFLVVMFYSMKWSVLRWSGTYRGCEIRSMCVGC